MLRLSRPIVNGVEEFLLVVKDLKNKRVFIRQEGKFRKNPEASKHQSASRRFVNHPTKSWSFLLFLSFYYETGQDKSLPPQSKSFLRICGEIINIAIESQKEPSKIQKNPQ